MTNGDDKAIDLTKREALAAILMAGMFANSGIKENDLRAYAYDASRAADDLIDGLNGQLPEPVLVEQPEESPAFS